MAKKNRQAAEEFIIKFVEELLPNGTNAAIYKRKFEQMNDKEFDEFVARLKSGEDILGVVAPNYADVTLSAQRNIGIAKKYNCKIFERLWIGADGNSPTYLTPIPYMVIDLPVCRLAQVLEKKIALPVDNKSIDDRTGQPTGKSKGSAISYHETQVLAAMGLDKTLEEFLKFRGGDLKGFDAMNNSISKTGGVSMKAIENFSSGVEATKVLKILLTCMHYEVDL